MLSHQVQVQVPIDALIAAGSIAFIYGLFFGFVWGVLYTRHRMVDEVQKILQSKVDSGELTINFPKE